MKSVKTMVLVALLVLTGCSQQGPLKVKSIDILPPGGDVDSITAYVDIQGTGIARLDWERRAFGIDSLVQTEYWYIDSSDVYTSTLSVTEGWYWLSIYDEDSVLLATSDTIFCGTGSQIPPVAKFYAEPTEGVIPLGVEFHDQSLNDPTARLWKFGDGESSEGAWHYYEEPGNYDVTLIVSNITGTDTLTKENYIHAQLPPPPIADFYAEPTEGKGPFDAKFYDQSLNDPTSWLWDFGDGYTSTEPSNPYYPLRHTYGYPPDSNLPYLQDTTFTVMLIVSNPGGEDTMIKENYIHYEPPDPFPANFYADPTHGRAPLTVIFVNTSQYGPYPRAFWDLGDGSHNNTLDKFWHTYSYVGVYTVTLIASSYYGSDTLTKKDYITVTE
jgi:PKD repeat protein